jgi:zincin-like metallopeptidase toxin 3 of polymorphic toxin system
MITDQLQARFPLCKHYIEQFLSNKRQLQAERPRIFNAFARACTAELEPDQVPRARDRIDEVFTIGDGPIVVPKKLPPIEGGLFTPSGLQHGQRRFIYLNETVLNAYENGTGWIVLEGIALHECVHWVRFHAGNGDEEGGDWNTLTFERFNDGTEVGERFDIWAYGFNPAKFKKDGSLEQYGPPGTTPKGDEDESTIPTWAQGWWTVWDGNYYYYYFYPDGKILWTKTKPNTPWPPAKGNQGTAAVSDADHGFKIRWSSGTEETFTRMNWSSTTEMFGKSNRYGQLSAKKVLSFG